jgi:hypothetical protein
MRWGNPRIVRCCFEVESLYASFNIDLKIHVYLGILATTFLFSSCFKLTKTCSLNVNVCFGVLAATFLFRSYFKLMQPCSLNINVHSKINNNSPSFFSLGHFDYQNLNFQCPCPYS